MYQKWIESIEQHQNFDRSKQFYNVCIRHFQAEDVEIRGKKKSLKKGAVRSIFEYFLPVDDEIFNEPTASANQDIMPLENRMLSLTLNNDIKTQELENRIKSLQDLREEDMDKIKLLQESSKLDKNTIAELQKILAQEKRRIETLEQKI